MSDTSWGRRQKHGRFHQHHNNCYWSYVSCLSWSQYLKFQLASSDYEGIIRLWDVNVGQCTRLFDEHERRTWSVDICTANPTYIASGSDDATVKVWSTTCPRSIMTLQHNGNVCCAKFAPTVANLLAVGTAGTWSKLLCTAPCNA